MDKYIKLKNNNKTKIYIFSGELDDIYSLKLQKFTFDKLKKIVEWIKERVNIAFECIKRQGAKALQFLLRVLGIEVDGCKADGGPFALFPEE